MVGLYLRRSLPETEAFEVGQSQVDVEPGAPPPNTFRGLVRGLAANKISLLRMLGFSLASTVVYYCWAIGIASFAINSKDVPAAGALWGAVIANLFFMATLPLWGRLSDRYGRRPIFLVYCIAFVILSYPLLTAVNDSAVRMTLVTMVALFFLGAFVGIMPAYFAELFPTAVRASGIGVPYSFVVAIFGGTAPYLLTWLSSQGRQELFALYMVALAGIGAVTTLLTPETKGRDLT